MVAATAATVATMLRRTPLAISVVVLLSASCGAGSDADADSAPTSTGSLAATATTSATSSTVTTSTVSSTTAATSSTTTTTTTLSVESTVVADYSPAPMRPGDLVVHNGSTVSIVGVVDPGDESADGWEVVPVLGPIDGWGIDAARATLDGSIVVGLVALPRPTDMSADRKIVQFHPDGAISELASHMILFDVGLFGGVEMVIAAFDDIATGDAGPGTLLAIPTSGAPPVAVDESYDALNRLVALDVAGDVAVLTEWADEGRAARFIDGVGGELSIWHDLELLEFGPDVLFTLSPDGSELVWTDRAGIAVDEDHDVPVRNGDWLIQSWDMVEGEPRLWWPFDFAPLASGPQFVDAVVHTGELVVVSRASETAGAGEGEIFHLPLLVLDLRLEEPDLIVLAVSGSADVVPG